MLRAIACWFGYRTVWDPVPYVGWQIVKGTTPIPHRVGYHIPHRVGCHPCAQSIERGSPAGPTRLQESSDVSGTASDSNQTSEATTPREAADVRPDGARLPHLPPAGLGSPPPTSAPGLQHLRRRWARPGHICAGTRCRCGCRLSHQRGP